MIQLIVSDLDGTLLNGGQRIDPEDRKALRQAVQRGTEICLASGRMQEELNQVAEAIGLSVHGISQNGSFVQTRDGRSLLRKTFSLELAREIYDRTAEYDELFSMVCFEHRLLTPEKRGIADRIMKRLFAPIEVSPEIRQQLGREFLPCKFSFFGDLELIRRMKRDLEERYSGEIDLFISDKDCLDVMPVGVSKGNGLQVLVHHLGLGPDEVLCIGDAFNDVSMFEMFPTFSFAMDHSPDGVKKKARMAAGSVAEAVHRVMVDS
ncbi:Cof-type HAD-IIB family hydrolase [Paludifilum halophilum]|uniref:Cof-type HAD-IIB family hydrolase n=1 Tax=Paludifilum halophilum TaxID=1642702 RepID=UPI00146E333D|nr:Cof-type HAD-IIB family hydrolase [Paludifilum halophilum]